MMLSPFDKMASVSKIHEHPSYLSKNRIITIHLGSFGYMFSQNQQPGAEEAFKILGHAFDLIGDVVSYYFKIWVVGLGDGAG